MKPFDFIKQAFRAGQKKDIDMNKYLIVGLGNVGEEYIGTRHNVGFRVVNELVPNFSCTFSDQRYGAVAKVRVKNKQLIVLKPSTFMNLSGNAVRYWMQKENIPQEQILIVVDDLSLPLGTLRLKPSGSDAGHNGLKHIAQVLGNPKYARLRVGIGNEFTKGQQVDFVLGHFEENEEKQLPAICQRAVQGIKTYVLAGIGIAMNELNKKPQDPVEGSPIRNG